MAKRIPVDQLRGVVNMGRVAEESMDENIRISVLVDTTCPRWLGIAIRDALVPERDAFVDVKEIVARPEVKGFDVGIIVAGRSDELVCDAMRTFAALRQRVIVVAESSLDIPETNLPLKLKQFVTEVVASDDVALVDRFANALLDSTEKDVSCAANFAFCREVATARLVSRVAARNAIMVIADFIPGAGMPLMTTNQVNLGFDIAATHGKGLSIARFPEIVFIVAAGFAYRRAAKLAMRLLPALSLLIRIGFAYGGTLVTGRILATHFTGGNYLPGAVASAFDASASASVPAEVANA